MHSEITTRWIIGGTATVALAALISALLVILLRPLLVRYALARPNVRSSHKRPTPQGGGIAVVAATLVTICAAPYFWTAAASTAGPPLGLFAAVILIAGVGAADDVRSIGVMPRFLLQIVIVGFVVYGLPASVRVAPLLPWWFERALLLVGGLWFVNLVNFMDGLDWMTVAEVVPMTAALAVFGMHGMLPPEGMVVALALCGAMIGFAWFNRPIASLFLGDVGSLPIGLLVGWLLVLLAGRGGLAAAILLPLYYLADATITLMRRVINGEPFWLAHRTHFYQRATDVGFSATEVVARVFAVNLGLCALAAMTAILPGKLSDAAALVGGATLVTWLLAAFARGKK